MRGYTVTLFSGAPLRSDIEVWEFWIISLGIDSLNRKRPAAVSGGRLPAVGGRAAR